MGLKTDGARRVLAAYETASVTYVGQHTQDPTEASPAEVAGAGYARVRVAAGGWTVAAAIEVVEIDGEDFNVLYMSNTAAVTFPTPTAAWTDGTHFGLWDAAAGGNLDWSGPLTNDPDAPAIGSVVSYALGTLKLGLIVD